MDISRDGIKKWIYVKQSNKKNIVKLPIYFIERNQKQILIAEYKLIFSKIRELKNIAWVYAEYIYYLASWNTFFK